MNIQNIISITSGAVVVNIPTPIDDLFSYDFLSNNIAGFILWGIKTATASYIAVVASRWANKKNKDKEN